MGIKLIDGKFVLNNKPFFIFSGEIHYFRIPKNKWKLHLQKAKKAGLNTVSSYIPWIWHEYEEGKFDFTGKTLPERDLITFIKMVKTEGLYFIARIGPVSNAELKNEGLPEWLLRKHPEIRVTGKGLPNLPHVTLISYHNPVFKEYVKKWYSQILPIVEKEQITVGGNIILVQLCNEIGMVHWVNRMPDYSQQTTKMYREFLKNKYQTIEELNKSYKKNYKNFNEILQPENTVKNLDEPSIVKYTDWMYFYSWYYALYYKFLYDIYKEYKLQLPVIANIPQFYDFDVRGRGVYSPTTTIMFREFNKFIPDVIFGGAYQMRHLDYENFHDISITTEIVKTITSPGIPNICCELQTGILRDRPKIYSQDVELNLKTSIAHGLNGINCYMFSGGKGKVENEAFGSYHEWQAPISSEGIERSHIKPIELLGMFIKAFGEKLVQTKKVIDTTVGFYPRYYATALLQGKDIEELEVKRTQLFFDGIARLLQLGGFNYSVIDLEGTTTELLKNCPHLWVFTEFINLEIQKKLIDYVKSGGKLIISPQISTYMANEFKIRIEKILKEDLVYINGKDIYVSTKIQTFSKVDKSETIATTLNGQPCGILKNINGGKLLLLGFGFTHFFDYHIELIKEFAKLLEIQPSIQIDPPDVCATIRKNTEFGFLFIANFHNEPKETTFLLTLPGEDVKIRLPNKGKIFMHNYSSQILPLNVPLDKEIKIRYSTIEVLSYRISHNNTMLTVYTPSQYRAEIELRYPKKPKIIKVDNEKINYKFENGILNINFCTSARLQKILIQ